MGRFVIRVHFAFNLTLNSSFLKRFNFSRFKSFLFVTDFRKVPYQFLLVMTNKYELTRCRPVIAYHTLNAEIKANVCVFNHVHRNNGWCTLQKILKSSYLLTVVTRNTRPSNSALKPESYLDRAWTIRK